METEETEEIEESTESWSGPFAAVCVCGKKCTSKPGLTLHQKNCDQAKEAQERGDPTVKELDAQAGIEFVPEVQELISMVKDLAVDAHMALVEGNKSAGRRARIALTQVGKRVTPLRKQILDKMKG